MAVIRQAGLSDVEILARLNSEVQQLHHGSRPDIFKPVTDLGMIAQDFRERVLAAPDGFVLLVEADGMAVGYVVAETVTRPETAFSYDRKYVHIDAIGVLPACQGRGYGGALVAAVFEQAQSQGITRVTLNSWAFNTDAHAFFRRCGFAPYVHQFECFVGADD